MNDPATDKKTRPVSDWENKAVNMHALCDRTLWDDHKRDVQELRERQARYVKSLPKEPYEALRAIGRLLHPNCGSYPGGFEDALHLAVAIEELVRNVDLDVADARASLTYLAEKAVEGLMATRNSLDQIGDIVSAALKAETSEK